MSGDTLAVVAASLLAVGALVFFLYQLAAAVDDALLTPAERAARHRPSKRDDPERDVEFVVQMHCDGPTGRQSSWSPTTVRGRLAAEAKMRQLYSCNLWGDASAWPMVTVEKVTP